MACILGPGPCTVACTKDGHRKRDSGATDWERRCRRSHGTNGAGEGSLPREGVANGAWRPQGCAPWDRASLCLMMKPPSTLLCTESNSPLHQLTCHPIILTPSQEGVGSGRPPGTSYRPGSHDSVSACKDRVELLSDTAQGPHWGTGSLSGGCHLSGISNLVI